MNPVGGLVVTTTNSVGTIVVSSEEMTVNSTEVAETGEWAHCRKLLWESGYTFSHREHNREVFERTPEEAAEHHERKKLQLKPRTKPLEVIFCLERGEKLSVVGGGQEMHEDAAGQQRSSIFGNAKPRDEAE